MSKKKSQSNSFIFKVIALVLAIASICLMFAPHVKWKFTDNTTYNGIKTVFGYKSTYKGILIDGEVTIFKFSFMNLVPYLLLLGGIVLFFVFNVLGNKKKTMALVICGLFVVAGILFFLNTKFLVLGDGAKEGKEYFELTYGAYVAGVLSIIAGGSLLLSQFVD